MNDAHSLLNPTYVSAIERPGSLAELRGLYQRAATARTPLSLCGGRHAAGGQQFLTDQLLLDTSNLRSLLSFDPDRRLAEFEAGANWSAVLAALRAAQPGTDFGLTIHQRQGGAEELTLGGAVGSNIHSRCLDATPFVGDIESLQVLEPDGSLVRCSRTEHADRFRHIIGGYGLFGLVYSVQLRLRPRVKLIQRVRPTTAGRAVAELEEAIRGGSPHGAFEFSIDERSPGFMSEGLLVHFDPAADSTPVRPATPPDGGRAFLALAALAHTDKPRAWAAYTQTMLGSAGEVDFSDTWQSSNYVTGYHATIEPDRPGSEILSEIDVPRDRLPDFLSAAAELLRQRDANLIYGIVRLIRADTETALPWAKRDYACVIFNLHSLLAPAAIAETAETIRALYDLALARGGCYYLTYHRFARKDQVLRAYPELPAVLRAKSAFDSRDLLQSNWYRHYRNLLL